MLHRERLHVCYISLGASIVPRTRSRWPGRGGWKGKIDHVRFVSIHVNLKKTVQYLLSQILQIRLLGFLDVVVCRHTELPHKIVSIVSISPDSVFSHNFYYYYVSIIFNLCHNVLICKRQGIISFECERIRCKEICKFEVFTRVG